MTPPDCANLAFSITVFRDFTAQLYDWACETCILWIEIMCFACLDLWLAEVEGKVTMSLCVLVFVLFFFYFWFVLRMFFLCVYDFESL